uniref:Uncharacterized protein n=1 Tax=Romanomermis culicivorax TaxID=13658 RepID=A0A915L6M3_ROMCU
MTIYMFPDSTLFGDSQLLVQQKQEKRASVDEGAPRRSTREQTSEKTIKGPYKKRKKSFHDKIE